MAPTRPLTFYAYAVVDLSAEPAVLIETKNTRREAREFVRWQPNADNLRIRRARVTLYQK